MGKSVTRSNLSKANELRDYRILEDFAYHLVAEARSKSKVPKHKGGTKIHTLYNIDSQIPAFFHITTASINDIKALPEIPYEKGAYYIFDRGYNDFSNPFKIEQIEATFVLPLVSNME